MDGFKVPAAGLKLAHVPKPVDPHKRDKFPPAVIVDLGRDGLEDVLPSCQDGFDVAASFGTRSLTRRTSDGRIHKEEIAGKVLERSLYLSESGFIYKTNERAEMSTLRSRLDLRLPKEKDQDGVDEGLLALTRGMHDAKAHKQSSRTTLAEPTLSGRRRKSGKTSLVSQLTGGNNLKAHRAGMFDRGKQLSSLTNSPSLVALGASSSKDRKKTAVQEAKKRALLHLLAVRPDTKAGIATKLKCMVSDIEELLNRYRLVGRVDASELELVDRAYKQLDPYGFGYPEADRKHAIDRAIKAFDRMRIATNDKLWQMLLSEAERGSGKCLSALANKMNANPAPKPQEASGTPVPEINVSEAASPANENGIGGGEMSRKRSSSDSGHGDPQERAAKRPKSTITSREKRLFGGPKQREKELAKEKAKEAKQMEKSAAHPSPRVSAATSAVTAAAKRADPKASAAPAAGKVKSSEFVHESDDEEADAVVKSAQEKQATKTNAKPDPKVEVKAAVKPLQRPSAKAAPSVKSAPKTSEKTTQQRAVSSTVKSTPSAVTTEKAPKPNAWDFSVNKKQPSAVAVPARSTAKLPSSRTGNLSGRKQLPATTARGAAPSSSLPREDAAASKPATKLPDKPASQRTDLMRKLDSAKRNPSSDPKTARTSSLKSTATNGTPGASATAKTGAPLSRPDRPVQSSTSGGRLTAPSTPGRSSESGRPQPMQRTISHQRKSSSPLKPSPLAASPPINLSDISDAQRGNDVTKAVAKKAVAYSSDSKVPAAKPLKRKADELDGKKAKTSTPALSSVTNGERPAKRRETGTAVSSSAGAASSSFKSVAPRQSDGSSLAKARRYSHEEGGNLGNKSHSPSPASSTIGSTSTKGTSMSLLTNNGSSKDRAGSAIKSTVGTKNEGRSSSNGSSGGGGGGGGGGNVSTSKGKTLPMRQADEDGRTFKGIKHSEVARLLQFEEDREEYNRKQRAVAAMEDPPIEKVRELNKLFHSLETQKKVFASLEHA